MAEKWPNNKFFRRLALVWAMIIITWVVWVVFTGPPQIAGGTAAALGTVVGILATVIGFYQWSRDRDDQQRKDPHVDTD